MVRWWRHKVVLVISRLNSEPNSTSMEWLESISLSIVDNGNGHTLALPGLASRSSLCRRIILCLLWHWVMKEICASDQWSPCASPITESLPYRFCLLCCLTLQLLMLVNTSHQLSCSCMLLFQSQELFWRQHLWGTVAQHKAQQTRSNAHLRER